MERYPRGTADLVWIKKQDSEGISNKQKVIMIDWILKNHKENDDMPHMYLRFKFLQVNQRRERKWEMLER